MPDVKYIYLEKPVCASPEEEKTLNDIAGKVTGTIRIQVGFQYLQTPSIRKALKFWKSGILGKPIHFDLKYHHGDYLKKEYREKRITRLTPAPDGGAMADLGSHGISLLVAFLGGQLQILHSLQAGTFDGVPEGSDLFSSISLIDPETRAVGQLSASRISSGTGDLVAIEVYAQKGMFRYSSHYPEYFEYYLEESGKWIREPAGSDYLPVTGFPSVHVSPGWLRSLVHAHYVFLTDGDREAFIPDLKHGLNVQRLVRETAENLLKFRLPWNPSV
jgi:predicted dehydrogenase